MEGKLARRLIRLVDEGVQFYFSNGFVARDLHGLLIGVRQLSKEEFEHHVYFDHNDFSNWLLDVVGDTKLAREIFHASQDKIISLIQARYHFLLKKSKVS